MEYLKDLETPAVIVDLDIMEKNLKHTAELARNAGVKLRPHCKTHKSIWIAKKQLEYGAAGITVAKLSEAEVMADGGIDDILVAYPIVGEKKLKRLENLIKRASIIVCTDSVEVSQGLSDLGVSMGRKIRTYVQVNSGLQRCGREPGEETVELVKSIIGLPGIEIIGLITHAGFSYDYVGEDSIRAAAHKEADALLTTKKMLEKEGIEIKEISVGSTPTSKFIGEMSGVTEVRPGAYVFGDDQQLSTGIITEDECAMHVLTTVVSTPREGSAIADAGLKTLCSDGCPHREGYGMCRTDHRIYISDLCEEHGIMKVPSDVKLKVGDRLEILPNHCCAAANMHDYIYGVRNGIVERTIKIDARGKVL